MLRRVLVTGTGVVSSIGQNRKEFEQSLKSGRSGIDCFKKKIVPEISINIGAEINDFSFMKSVESYSSLPEDLILRAKKSAGRSPLTIQTSVISALEAWQNSRLHSADISAGRIGLIAAGNNLNQNYQYNLYPKFIQTPEYLNPRYPLHYMDTDHVGTLSEIFQIRGEGFTVGGASASGNVGIIKGCQLIQAGLVDVCMVVGVMADLSPMELQGFCNIGAMGGKNFHDRPSEACRPFDSDHEGFIYGQAGGCIILESEDSANRRNANILVEVLGSSLNLDGNRMADPGEDGEVRAMETALERAGVKPKEVEYLNAHGSSSPIGDVTEVKAIKRVFKDSLPDLWINSTKGLAGHCLYSAGVIEAIAVLIQMQRGFVHPNKNLDNPIDMDCRFCKAKAEQDDIGIAMSNSFGFGGINTSIVFKK